MVSAPLNCLQFLPWSLKTEQEIIPQENVWSDDSPTSQRLQLLYISISAVKHFHCLIWDCVHFLFTWMYWRYVLVHLHWFKSHS